MDFFRICRQFSSRSRKIIENLQFTVQIEIFTKNTVFALPPPTLGSVARPPMHDNSVPGRVFGSRRDLLRNNFEARRSPPKLM